MFCHQKRVDVNWFPNIQMKFLESQHPSRSWTKLNHSLDAEGWDELRYCFLLVQSVAPFSHYMPRNKRDPFSPGSQVNSHPQLTNLFLRQILIKKFFLVPAEKALLMAWKNDVKRVGGNEWIKGEMAISLKDVLRPFKWISRAQWKL